MGAYHSRKLRGRVSISTRKSQHRLLTILLVTISLVASGVWPELGAAQEPASAGDNSALSIAHYQWAPHSALSTSQCPGEQFTDVCPGDWFYSDVMGVYGLNAITGYSDHTFRPSNTVSRGQLMKVVVIALDLSANLPSTPTFTAAPTTHPFYSWIEIGVANDVANGYTCGGLGEP